MRPIEAPISPPCAIPVETLASSEGTQTSLRALSTSKANSFFSLPLTDKHWTLFWLLAVWFLIVAGWVFGAIPCVIAGLFSIVAAIVIKLVNDHWKAANTPVVSSPVPCAISAKPESTEFKTCPFCAEVIRHKATLCRFCQKDVSKVAGIAVDICLNSGSQNESGAPLAMPRKAEMGLLLFLGIVMLLGGAIGAAFYINMDTTLPVSGGFGFNAVHNAGLMQDRLIGVIASVATCGIGLALAIVGQMNCKGK